MTTSLLPAPHQPEIRSLATMHELSVDDVVAQVQKIQGVMAKAMQQDEHYGVIPGTGSKPSLLKAGAEKLCLLFRLDPQYEIVEKVMDGNHCTITSRCTLYHIPTGNRMGSGMASCSTKESRYAYRQAKRACPKCGAEAIIRSKYPPKDKRLGTDLGWYCFTKQGGCGVEFSARDEAIINQPLGRVLNPDLPDQWNTVLKMSNKRSLVAAVLNVTAASDIFTQDLEDVPMADAKSPVESAAATKKTIVIDAPPKGEITIEVDSPAYQTIQNQQAALEETQTEVADQEAGNDHPTRTTAPVSEWLAAFTEPTTPKGLHMFWKACTAPDLWKTWTPEEQGRLIAAKDAAKARLGVA